MFGPVFPSTAGSYGSLPAQALGWLFGGKGFLRKGNPEETKRTTKAILCKMEGSLKRHPFELDRTGEPTKQPTEPSSMVNYVSLRAARIGVKPRFRV